MNVFVRVAPTTRMRRHLAAACVSRIRSEAAISYLLLMGGTLTDEDWWCGDDVRHYEIWGDDFHLASKRKAAELATTDWLLIVDDDQLPLYRDWVGYAVSLTKRFPEYSAIAGWSVTHEVPRPESLIVESDSIGCPMIVRRQALLDATSEPIENVARADTILTARLQKHGKTGIARNWRYNHLGMGYSQVIPQHWMPECPV